MSIDLTAELFAENATAVVDDVETAASSSGELPPGKYHVRLEGAQQKDVGDMPVWELSFLIIGGAFKGRKTRYSLWLGTKETDKEGNAKSKEKLEEDKKRIRNEFWHAAGVLGLATKTKGTDGKDIYKMAQGKRDFRDVVGAECVVETGLRATKDKDGNDKKYSEVKMFGIYAVR